MFRRKQYAVNKIGWKYYYMFRVRLSAIGSNKNTAVNYTLGFGLLWKLILKKLRFIYWLCHRTVWLVLIPVFSIFHFKPYKEDHLWYIFPSSTEWALTHLCKYTAFCVASSHSNTFKIIYILLKFTQQNRFSCCAIAFRSQNIAKHPSVCFKIS